MVRVPDVFSARIVAIGAFNPAIFTPDWLERNNLIGPEDAEAARESDQIVVTRQLAVIDTDWFTLQVMEERLTISSKGPVAPTLKDLGVGIFGLVSQTPVTAVGLNFSGDFKMATLKERHQVGDMLAPKGVWNEIFPTKGYNIGLLSLTMQVQEGSREDEAAKNGDVVNVSVQPSTPLANGIHLNVNHHFDLSHRASDDMTVAECTAKLIEDQWQKCWTTSTEIFDKILNRSLATD